MGYFLAILLILFEIFSKTISTNQENVNKKSADDFKCKKLDELRLEMLLLTAEIEFYEDKFRFFKKQNELEQNYFRNQITSKLNRQTCAITHYLKLHRNQYPFIEKIGKCDVKKCSENQSLKNCNKLFHHKIVLLKKGCDQDGFEIWVPHHKKTIVSCECS